MAAVVAVVAVLGATVQVPSWRRQRRPYRWRGGASCLPRPLRPRRRSGSAPTGAAARVPLLLLRRWTPCSSECPRRPQPAHPERRRTRSIPDHFLIGQRTLHTPYQQSHHRTAAAVVVVRSPLKALVAPRRSSCTALLTLDKCQRPSHQRWNVRQKRKRRTRKERLRASPLPFAVMRVLPPLQSHPHRLETTTAVSRILPRPFPRRFPWRRD